MINPKLYYGDTMNDALTQLHADHASNFTNNNQPSASSTTQEDPILTGKPEYSVDGKNIDPLYPDNPVTQMEQETNQPWHNQPWYNNLTNRPLTPAAELTDQNFIDAANPPSLAARRNKTEAAKPSLIPEIVPEIEVAPEGEPYIIENKGFRGGKPISVTD